MKEKELVNELVNKLRPYFFIDREVRSDSGKSRVDLYLQNKKNTRLIFGVECKDDGYKKGKDTGNWVLQAAKYTKEKFMGNHIPIIIFPAITGNYLIEADLKHTNWNPHNNVGGLLYKLTGIGEIRQYSRFDSECISIIWGNYKIWGVEDSIEFLSIDRYNRVLNKYIQ